jgi:hypothetical protein
VHICPSTAYQCAKTLFLSSIDVGCSLWGFVASIMTLTMSFGLRHTPYLPCHLHKCNSVRVYPYAHPQHVKVLKHFVYIQFQSIWICYMWVFAASTMTPQRHLSISHPIPFSLKIHPHFSRCNSVRAYLYVFWQHCNVLKHFIYVICECGKQSAGAYRPSNHDIMVSCVILSEPQPQPPHLHKCNSIRECLSLFSSDPHNTCLS